MSSLAIFLFAGLGFFLVASWSRLWGAALVLLLLPVYQVRASILGMPVTLLELFLVLLAVAWVLERRRSVLNVVSTLPWRWTILLLLLAATIGIFVAPDHTSALGYWKAYFLEPIVFFILLWDIVRTDRDVRLLLVALGAAALLLSLVALEQYLGLLPSPEPWISESPHRVASLFAYPNALGLFLAPLVGLFSAFFFFSSPHERRAQRWFFAGVVVLGFLAMVFAVSRGGVAAAGIGLALLGIFSRYRRWTLIVAAALVLVVLALPSTRTAVASIFDRSDVSTDVRLVLWQGTAKLLRAHPIEGAGLGGFPALYDRYRLIKHTELLQYPHNIILNAWVEIGLGGMLLFCWLLFAAARRGFRALQAATTPFARTLLLGTLTALFVLILHGIVDVPYFKNDLAIQFWFLLALVPIGERLHDLDERG